MTEDHITDLVLQHPEQLGYDPASPCVKAFKWGDAAGISDAVIFPKTGPHIAIIEVKRAVSDEANALVVGQVLKYYARALRMGSDGIADLLDALRQRGAGLYDACSPKSLWGCSESDADLRCAAGRRLTPDDIALHIVVDDAPQRMQLRLVRTCYTLRRHHQLTIRVWRLNSRRDGIEPIPGPRTDVDGKAYAGSQRQIQLYVNRYQERLDNAICDVVPEFGGHQADITWVSPRVEDGCREYRDAAALKKLGLQRLTGTLADFWPAGGPQWDALATLRTREGQTGILLLEAKSHINEVSSGGSDAEDAASIGRIRRALDAAKRHFGASQNADWLGPYYQSANRLAHLYFFREIAGIQAWLINLYFEDDPAPIRRTTREAWQSKLSEIRRALGCDGVAIPFSHTMFLKSIDEAWCGDDAADFKAGAPVRERN